MGRLLSYKAPNKELLKIWKPEMEKCYFMNFSTQLKKHYEESSFRSASLSLCTYIGISVYLHIYTHVYGLSLWLRGKESTCNAGAPGDTVSTPGLGRSPGGGHGDPLQCSCLENLMDRGAWQATVHEVEKNQTQLK